MPKFKVHMFPVVRVEVFVEAFTMEEAIRKADEETDLHGMFRGEHQEFAEDIDSFCVIVNGDEDDEHTQWFEKDGVTRYCSDPLSVIQQDFTQIVKWNTRRGYSAHGQRIAAYILNDGRVAFADADRGLSGITKAKIWYPADVQEFVMEQYDMGGGYTEGMPMNLMDLMNELYLAAQDDRPSYVYDSY